MTANGKASLVPIAILINGKFWDASAYKADPVPMSLDSGTVYEAERAGNSLGLFTVSSALHRNSSAPGALATWIGTGAFRPNGSEPDTKAAKAEPVPVGIDTSEGPPRLTRDPSAKDKPPDSAAPSSGNAPAGSSAPASAPKSNGPSGDEPPRLSKPASAPEPPANSGPGAKPSGSDSEAKPGDAKAGQSKADDKANVPASDSGASEANRPRLRRGKPPEVVADEDVPGYSKVGVKSTSTDLSKTPVATQGDVQLIPAISDAGGPDPRPYKYDLKADEEQKYRKGMLALAADAVRARIKETKPVLQGGKPETPAAKSTRAAKAVQPSFDDVQFRAFDLWNTNEPVFVLSATAHMPGSPGSEGSDVSYFVTLVAKKNIYDELRKLYAGVTDARHLDETPRLELIDAVDADGDGRGELLFKRISDVGSAWGVYRAGADQLFPLFEGTPSNQ